MIAARNGALEEYDFSGNLITGFVCGGQAIAADDDTVYVRASQEAHVGSETQIYRRAGGASSNDTTPPASVGNLASVSPGTCSITLGWTAPGDNGATGQAMAYNLRYSTIQIVDSCCSDPGSCVDFNNAPTIAQMPAPHSGGTRENYTLFHLSTGTRYYFAIKAIDNAGNVSAISNVAEGSTYHVSASTVSVNGENEMVFSSTQPSTLHPVSPDSPQGTSVLTEASAMGLAPVSAIYDMGPEGAVFDPPGIMIFHYSSSTLPAGDREEDLGVYHYNSLTGQLDKPLGQILDTENKTITVPISQFSSIFLVLASGPAGRGTAPGPDPSFRLGEVYAFPNPAKHGKRPTVHVECGIADSVDIRIYDIAGDQIASVQLGTPSIIDNKYAYEYDWDISDIASGVYSYMAQAKKAGEQEVRVMKKMAVIK
jgi:hypothetical protein